METVRQQLRFPSFNPDHLEDTVSGPRYLSEAIEPRCDPVIEGMAYLNRFLEPDRCDAILDSIDRQEWDASLTRRVQQYGYDYNFKSRQIDRAGQTTTLPMWLQPTAAVVSRFFSEGESVQQVIVNEYLPGQGIARHVDHPSRFGRTIAIVSLGSPVVMDFSRHDASGKLHMLLAPGSLLTLQGDARHRWKHGITGRKSDKLGELWIRRDRRVSLTFRSVTTSEST